MTSILELKKCNHNFLNFSGFASLSGYDPAMHRFFEALKQAIVDGVPALIRLHSTSEYQFGENNSYTVDMENHAVCVIGYDEENQSFAVMDPMKPDSIQWMRMDLLKTSIVDCTQGLITFLAPLWIEATKHATLLNVKVGFYIPKMNVMDKENMLISDVELIIRHLEGEIFTTSYSAHTKNALIPHTFKLEVPVDLNIVAITAKAKVSGMRPYEFSDYISSERSFTFVIEERSRLLSYHKPSLSKKVG
ncbi:MAG TPA: C39 family peptidase [Gammaproteobacteria bacterium]|nr:C39 family peptidase [Gammaproteobacteria bacterium]